MKKHKLFLALITALVSAGFVNSINYANDVSAATYQASITTSGTVNLDVSASGNGANVTTDSVNIVSTCPAGYTVSIAATSNTSPTFSDTTLYKDGNSSNTSATKKIPASTGTKDTPVSILGNNNKTWGYTTEAVNGGNPVTINSNFIGLTNTQTLLTQSSTGTTSTGTTLPVYYGVSVDPSIEPGQYKMSDNAVITYYLTTSLDCTSYQVAFNPTSTAGGQTVSGTGTMNNQRIAEGVATALDSNAFTAPSGYTFKEWNTETDGSGASYADKQEVTDIATVGNTITLYAQWESTSMLDTGQTVNRKLKRLAGNSSATYSTIDNNITALVRSDALPSGFTPTTDNTISTTNSGKPIYAWYDSSNKTIYYYSEATTIKMNQNSNHFFYNMMALSDLSTISSWDTSSVTNMAWMFSSAGYNAATFTLDLSSWDTSSVTDMSFMFYEAGFNATTWSIGDLSSWETSSVTDMYYMFYEAGHNATTFTLDLSSWDTSSVTDMSYMFYSAGRIATTFTLDLSSWNTASVTNMSYMFYYAGYNAATFTLDLSSWNTASVTDMSNMFYSAGYSATTFTLNLSSWNTSSVTNMSNMFRYAGRNATTWSIGDLSSWDTSSVTSMSNMFGSAGYNATTFTLDLSSWNTSSVTSMSGMFSSAGRSATTWSVTISKNNGAATSPINNTTSNLYGNSTSVTATPPSGKSFTLVN